MSNNEKGSNDAIADEGAKFDMLVGMGFSSAKARQAMKENDGDIDRALDSLEKSSKNAGLLMKAEVESPRATLRGVTALNDNDGDIDRAVDSLKRSKVTGLMKAEVVESPRATSRGVTALTTEEVRPGAFAVDGPDVEQGGIVPTVTRDSTIMLDSVNTSIPVAAELSGNHIDDFDRIEDQLRMHDEQLQQVLKDRENAPIAQVIDENGGFWNRKTKWLLVVAVLISLVIIGVVLGVVLPNDDEPITTTGTLSPTPPSPSASPPTSTSTPTTSSVPQDLIDLISSVSLDGGAALQTPSTPQNEALIWLAGNLKLDEYSDEKKIQRYVLATLYYSTNGPGWDEQANWMRNEDECSWYNDAEGEFCSSDGAVIQLDMWKNSLSGTLPEEIALLSDSLCKYLVCLLDIYVMHCRMPNIVFGLQ